MELLRSGSNLKEKYEGAVRVGFPDSDSERCEIEKMEEGRVTTGPASLQGLGLGGRRRKDAIAAGMKPGPVPVAQPAMNLDAQNLSGLPQLSSAPAPAPTQLHSISQTLKQIPLEIWESSTPILDALIKETLRVAQPHTAMRRNVGPEFYIDGKLVPSGAYVVYPFSDIHLDESIYEDAWKFDPGRWLDESGEEKKHKAEKEIPFGYIGWGAGECFVCYDQWI